MAFYKLLTTVRGTNKKQLVLIVKKKKQKMGSNVSLSDPIFIIIFFFILLERGRLFYTARGSIFVCAIKTIKKKKI